jgi:ferrous iron transport protein A
MERKIPIPLSQVDEGRIVVVDSIAAGRGLRARLTSMGLLPKTTIQVIRRERSGPLLVGIRNFKIALGRGVADKIMVI